MSVCSSLQEDFVIELVSILVVVILFRENSALTVLVSLLYPLYIESRPCGLSLRERLFWIVSWAIQVGDKAADNENRLRSRLSSLHAAAAISRSPQSERPMTFALLLSHA